MIDFTSSVTSTAPLSSPFWMVALRHTVTRVLPFRRLLLYDLHSDEKTK